MESKNTPWESGPIFVLKVMGISLQALPMAFLTPPRICSHGGVSKVSKKISVYEYHPNI